MAMEAETFETESPSQTEALGRDLAEWLDVGDCLALVGQLGSGKTVLVRGIATGLGLRDVSLVCSPTYVLVREYPGRVTVYHLDLYRLCGQAALDDLGVDEMLRDGVVVIEWADHAESSLPCPRWQVAIEVTGVATRRLHLRRIEPQP